MLGLRLPELLIILAVVLVVFGASRLPQLGAGLGKGLQSFKRAMGEVRGDEPAPPERQPEAPTAPPAGRPPSASA